MTSLDTMLATLQEWGKETEEVFRLYVFGSYARGEATEQSDLDLAVEIRVSPSKQRRETLEGIWTSCFKRWAADLKERLGIQSERGVRFFWLDGIVSVPTGARLIYERKDMSQ